MTQVTLYVYDLSRGLSRLLSQQLTGRYFEGIWHTGVVLYGQEYFYGQGGICQCLPGTLSIGQPNKKLTMGQTAMSVKEVNDYLDSLSSSEFRGRNYNIISHNCNSFSQCFVKQLTGNNIPSYITELPSQFLQTPIGNAVQSLLAQIQSGTEVIERFAPRVKQDLNKLNGNQNNFLGRFSDVIKPYLFEEPLSADYSPEELDILFSTCEKNLTGQWNFEARDILRSLNSVYLDECIGPEICSLLCFSHRGTIQQCRAICEVFRLAVWRWNELLVSLLTDPDRALHKLPDAYPSLRDTSTPTALVELDVSKARLLCNCLAIARDWRLSEGETPPLEPLIGLCTRLINYRHPGLPTTSCHQLRSSEHEQGGLALALNVSLSDGLNEESSLALGACLFHYIAEKKSFKQPIEAVFVTHSMFCLLRRFPELRSLAKAMELVECVKNLEVQVQDEDFPSNGYVDRHLLDEIIGLIGTDPV